MDGLSNPELDHPQITLQVPTLIQMEFYLIMDEISILLLSSDSCIMMC